jgi:predicted O-methyltransferase YrrM
MTSYDLSHLTQPQKQNVVGPIQDDEALFLYSLIRTMRLKRILEIGGDVGYSATNFLKAIGGNGIVYIVEAHSLPRGKS